MTLIFYFMAGLARAPGTRKGSAQGKRKEGLGGLVRGRGRRERRRREKMREGRFVLSHLTHQPRRLHVCERESECGRRKHGRGALGACTLCTLFMRIAAPASSHPMQQADSDLHVDGVARRVVLHGIVKHQVDVGLHFLPRVVLDALPSGRGGAEGRRGRRG